MISGPAYCNTVKTYLFKRSKEIINLCFEFF